MHFKNARNASVYAVFRAFFTQSLAKLRILPQFGIFFNPFPVICSEYSGSCYCSLAPLGHCEKC